MTLTLEGQLIGSRGVGQGESSMFKLDIIIVGSVAEHSQKHPFAGSGGTVVDIQGVQICTPVTFSMVKIHLVVTGGADVEEWGNQASDSFIGIGKVSITSQREIPIIGSFNNISAPAHRRDSLSKVLRVRYVLCTAQGVEDVGAVPIGRQRGDADGTHIIVVGGSTGKTGESLDGVGAGHQGAFVLIRIEVGTEVVAHLIAGGSDRRRPADGGTVGGDIRRGDSAQRGATAGGGGGSHHRVPARRSAVAVLAHIEVVGGAAGEAGKCIGEGSTVVDALARAFGVGVEVRIGTVFQFVTAAVARHGPSQFNSVPCRCGGGEAGGLHAGRLGEGVDSSLSGIVVGGESADSVVGGTLKAVPVESAALATGAEDVGARRHQAGEDAEGAAGGHRTVAELNLTVAVELQLEAVAVGAVGGNLAPFHRELLCRALVVDGVGRGVVARGVVQRSKARAFEACDALEGSATVVVDTQHAACGDLGFPEVHGKRHRNVYVASGLVSRRPGGGSRRANNCAVGGGGGGAVILAHPRVLSHCDTWHKKQRQHHKKS